MLARALAEYLKQHKAAVDAAWQAAATAMLMAEQNDKAKETAQVPALPAA